MQRMRARLAEWAALALALFLSSIATPRAGLYFHHHASGDHLHVHLDGEDHDGGHDHHHDHDVGDPHHHHHHAQHHRTHLAGCTANGPVIEAADDDGTGHWHSQDFFHRAVSPAVFAGQHAESVQVVHVLPKRPVVDRLALPIRVRGPPHAA